MRMNRCLLVVAMLGGALLCFAGSAYAEAIGANLLTSNQSGFEGADVGGWGLDPYCHQSSTYSASGTYSLEMAPTQVSYPRATLSLELVGNRAYYLNVSIREPSGPLAGRYCVLGSSQKSLDAGGYGYFKAVGTNISAAESGLAQGIVSTTLELKGYFASYTPAGRTAYFDNVILGRERVVPIVESDSLDGGSLEVGKTTVVSLFNTGNVNTWYDYSGTNMRTYFDPDVVIEATNATVGTVTWVSDNQIDVELTALAGGDVDLTLTNQYSVTTMDWTIGVVPEPASMCIATFAGILLVAKRKR